MRAEWLEPEVAAVALGVSRATVYRWIKDGCPSIKGPHGRLVNVDATRKWVRRAVVARRLTS